MKAIFTFTAEEIKDLIHREVNEVSNSVYGLKEMEIVSNADGTWRVTIEDYE